MAHRLNTDAIGKAIQDEIDRQVKNVNYDALSAEDLQSVIDSTPWVTPPAFATAPPLRLARSPTSTLPSSPILRGC